MSCKQKIKTWYNHAFLPDRDIALGNIKGFWRNCYVSAKLSKVIGLCDHFSDYWQINSNCHSCFGRRVKRAALGAYEKK